tara:strand:+ start:3501 stop:3887 length:387 start_codon:yes stop_codon:yes gene_type:complete
MDLHTCVSIEYLDLTNGDIINNLINSNQINYTIIKNKNKIHYEWIINNYNVNLNELLYNKLLSNLIIITKEDYNSLVGLLYSDNKQLLNYNDMYYIISIQPFMEFNSNINLNNKIKKKFTDKMSTLKR